MRKTFSVLVGLTALLSTASAVRADGVSFWIGYILGTGTTICDLYKYGEISTEDAKDFSEGFWRDLNTPEELIAKEEALQMASNGEDRDCLFFRQ